MEKAVKVLERVVPNVIVKSSATTSVSLPSPKPPPPHTTINQNSSRNFAWWLLLWSNNWYGVLEGITKPAIRRLARRGGVKRISGLIYEEVTFYPTNNNIDDRLVVSLKSSLRVSFVMLLHTLNTQRERPLHLLMSSTPWNDRYLRHLKWVILTFFLYRDVPFTDSVVKQVYTTTGFVCLFLVTGCILLVFFFEIAVVYMPV